MLDELFDRYMASGDEGDLHDELGWLVVDGAVPLSDAVGMLQEYGLRWRVFAEHYGSE